MANNDLYREEILEHWQNPQNFGVIDDADLVIEQVNPLCGDEVTFFFKFSPPVSSSRPLRPRSEARKRGSFDKLRTLSGFSIKSRMTGSSSRDSRAIKDVRFTGSGCAISIASASILSDNIKGKRIGEVSKITGEDVLGLLGMSQIGFPPARLKCAFLALEALRKISGQALRQVFDREAQTESAQGKLIDK